MDAAAQKRKDAVPGSPIGQQQAFWLPDRGMTRCAREWGASDGKDRTMAGGDAGAFITGAGAGDMVGRGGIAAGRGAGAARGAETLATDGGRGIASRRIGLGRAERFSRCALPTTAFFEMPIRRPISAVE